MYFAYYFRAASLTFLSKHGLEMPRSKITFFSGNSSTAPPIGKSLTHAQWDPISKYYLEGT